MAADYGYTSWDGTTQRNYYTDTNYIYAAYISLNRYHTDSYISSGNQLRLNLVTAHEFGHALGLTLHFSYSYTFILILVSFSPKIFY